MMGSAIDRLRLSAAAMITEKKSGENEKESEKMPRTTDEPIEKYPDFTSEMLANAVSGLVPEAEMASAIKAAEVKAAEDGKTAEAKRVSDVMSLSMPGYEKEIAAMALDGKTTKAEAALALLELERGKRNVGGSSEILLKKFSTSFTEAQAAFLEAWRGYLLDRFVFAGKFSRPIYELFFSEAWFLSGDPLIRRAWLGSQWIGDAKGHIMEPNAIKSAVDRSSR